MKSLLNEMSSRLDYSGKNPNREGEVVDDIDFPGVLIRSMQNIQELIKNNMKYSGETQKNSCEISRGFGFWP